MNRAALAGWQVLGDSDAKRTMETMARNVRASLGSRVLTQAARDIVSRLAPRDCRAQAEAVREWVSMHFRFINDPLGVELLETPAFLLDEITARGFVQGDCDDAATLCAALGLSIGIAGTLTAYAFHTRRSPFSHVVCHLWPSGVGALPRVECDITRPKGMRPPPVSRRLTVRV